MKVERGGALLKKIIISIGLILLVAGVVIFVFPAQETYLETSTAKTEDLQSRTIAPQDYTSYGSFMNSSRWFQLNISSSNSSGAPAPVKLTVSVVQHVGSPGKVPLLGYPQIGSVFNKNVPASATGTYYVDIENENPFSVTLEGNIRVQQTNEKYRTVYPYVIPGFLIMIVGAGALIYGIFKKPSKFKRTVVKKIKR